MSAKWFSLLTTMQAKNMSGKTEFTFTGVQGRGRCADRKFNLQFR
jgi:hypothetical protein